MPKKSGINRKKRHAKRIAASGRSKGTIQPRTIICDRGARVNAQALREIRKAARICHPGESAGAMRMCADLVRGLRAEIAALSHRARGQRLAQIKRGAK